MDYMAENAEHIRIEDFPQGYLYYNLDGKTQTAEITYYNKDNNNQYVFGDWEKATLYVPKGCIDVNKSATGWSYFFNILEGDYSGINDVTTDDVAGEVVS